MTVKLSQLIAWLPQDDGTWEFRRHDNGNLWGWGVRGMKRFHVFSVSGRHGSFATPLDFLRAADKTEIKTK